jgi:uroporphyrinogen decarboxylase
MDARENTVKAIEFRGPERLPEIRSAMVTDPRGDVVFVFCEMGRKWWLSEGGEDEWGCVWQKTDLENMGQISRHPLKDWHDLPAYRGPDANDPVRHARLPETLAGLAGKYVVLANGPAVFERMHFLHGFAETLEDLYLEPARIAELAERLIDFQVQTVENIARRFPGQIHGFRCTDDWGTQQSTIISVALWREAFRPHYRRLFDAIHRRGMHTWLHSCGRINDLIGEFIDIGLDVINLSQPRLLGIEEIGRRYAGRICFESHGDIQSTLPDGDENAVRAEVALLLKCWTTKKGGFILGDCFPEVNHIRPELRNIMEEAFRELDPWRPPAPRPV